MDSSKSRTRTYRVQFHNARQIYEVYVREIYTSDIYGFVELRKFVFGKPSQVVIDPSEEKLRSEFGDVDSTLVPVHAIIRIDEVKKEGTPKITEGDGSNVMPFPMPVQDKKR
ncbi:MAG: DUF1820 family protein [Gammaproteobacteria bacterium]|nr:DUF1820 family protein [Gammaproteobacteria bacterium]